VVIANRRLFGAGASLFIPETKRKSIEELTGMVVIIVAQTDNGASSLEYKNKSSS
jgi:hypothetical protein